VFRLDSNLDDVRRKLEALQKRLGSLDGQQVSFGELFDPPFMFKYTQFRTLNEMFEAGGFHFSSQTEWDKLPKEELDRHVAAHTQFASWSQMQAAAAEEWTKRMLGL
jgi:hypothetical protein